MAATNLVFHLASLIVLFSGTVWILRLQKRNEELRETLVSVLTGKPGRTTVSTIEDVLKWSASHLDARLEITNERHSAKQLLRINRSEVLGRMIQWSVCEIEGNWQSDQKLQLVLKIPSIPDDSEAAARELAQLFGNQVSVKLEDLKTNA